MIVMSSHDCHGAIWWTFKNSLVHPSIHPALPYYIVSAIMLPNSFPNIYSQLSIKVKSSQVKVAKDQIYVDTLHHGPT